MNSHMSPAVSMISMSSEYPDSPSRQPPPYRLPPQISPMPSPLIQSPQVASVPPSMTTVGLPILEPQTKVQYKDCVNEFQQAMNNFYDLNRVDVTSRKNSFEQIIEEHQTPPSLPPRKRSSADHRSISRENSIEQQPMQQPYPLMEREENKENIVQSHESNFVTPTPTNEDENKISVKEAMMKFNRYASEEEAKMPSPLSKPVSKKPEKVSSFRMPQNHKEHFTTPLLFCPFQCFTHLRSYDLFEEYNLWLFIAIRVVIQPISILFKDSNSANTV